MNKENLSSISKKDLTEKQQIDLNILNSHIGDLIIDIENKLKTAGLSVMVSGITFTEKEENSLLIKMKSGSDGCCTCKDGMANKFACPCNMCGIDFGDLF